MPDNKSTVTTATVITAPVYSATITTTSGNAAVVTEITPYGVWQRRLDELSSIAETAFKNRSDSYEKLAAEKILRDQNATYLGLLRGEDAKDPGSLDTEIALARLFLSKNNDNITDANVNIAKQKRIIAISEAEKTEADAEYFLNVNEDPNETVNLTNAFKKAQAAVKKAMEDGEKGVEAARKNSKLNDEINPDTVAPLTPALEALALEIDQQAAAAEQAAVEKLAADIRKSQDIINGQPSKKLRDFQHGRRLFGDNNNELSPKFGTMYHVFFGLSSALSTTPKETLYTPVLDSVKELGMLVKNVDLPSFSIETKDLNAYNQHATVQTGIKYEPINITFHDDSANVVQKFWEDYMRYYYKDLTQADSVYQAHQKNRYASRQGTNFGYYRASGSVSTRYLDFIDIYSLSLGKYTCYTLINPIIESWKHGTHTAGQYEFLSNAMRVRYELVRYSEGTVENLKSRGFGDLHYDNSQSGLTQVRTKTPPLIQNPNFQIGGSKTLDALIKESANKYETTRSIPLGGRLPVNKASTLGSRLSASIRQAGNNLVGAAIGKAENRLRSAVRKAPSVLQPALQNTISYTAQGLASGAFSRPNSNFPQNTPN